MGVDASTFVSRELDRLWEDVRTSSDMHDVQGAGVSFSLTPDAGSIGSYSSGSSSVSAATVVTMPDDTNSSADMEDDAPTRVSMEEEAPKTGGNTAGDVQEDAAHNS